MKIAMLNSLYAPYQFGGAERSTQLVAEGLARQGHSVQVITLGKPDLPASCVINQVSVRRLPLENWYWPYSGSLGGAAARAAWHLRDFHNAAMCDRVARVLDEGRPDVLNTHSLAGFSVAVWNQARERGIPVVHTLRDYYLMCPPASMYRHGANCANICGRCKPFALYRRHASQAVQAVVGISRFILERHTGAGFFRQSRPAVIHNAVPATQGSPPKPRGDALVYGFIGRISPQKGIRWVLEAFAAAAGPRDRLVVAGTGEPAFVEALRQEFASPAVTFIGQVAPATFYDQVDVVVIPSLWHEPFGRIAIEPLAYGIPVIASRRGGLAEVVLDGVTGILVDPDDADSLARAMRRFSAELPLAGRLGRNCHRRLSDFSQESISAAYAGLLENVSRAGALLSAPPMGSL